MRLLILLVVGVTVIFGTGVWHDLLGACRVPVLYRVGDIDARFGIDEAEARRIIERAEMLWETPLNTDLFQYSDDTSSLPIHFVFDDRQKNADIEAELREDLAAKEGMTTAVAQQYETLIAQFRTLKKEYEARVIAYEQSLKAHNAEVERWNASGGAPEDVFADLEDNEDELQKEYRDLAELSESLQGLIVELNNMGAQGNSLVADYNTVVGDYNARFSESQEFTQGDYTRDAIHIYQFDSEDELTIVLAHEFGHALSLDHVENERSIMYHFMNKQDVALGLSPEDMAAYTAACVPADTIQGKAEQFFRSILARVL